MPGAECGMYAIVQTGAEPVQVPCIRQGPHRLHKLADYEWWEDDETTVVHENIFEG